MKRQRAKKKNPNPNPAFFNNVTMKPCQTWLMQFNNVLLLLFILFLPTQLGKHFFFDFSYLSGVRVDYLAPTIYLTDILALILIFLNLKSVIRWFINKKILILLLILLINLLFSQNIFISVYRYIKVLEIIGILFIFRQARLSKKLLLSGFLIGAVFELLLATAQFINKHSLQGLLYFFGERPLDLSLPGVAKASLNGVEILRPYGTFSHPNSLAGFYLLIYFFILTSKKFTNTFAKNILLLVCSLLIFLSFSKVAIATYLLFNFIYLWKSHLKKTCKLCLTSRIFVLLVVSLVFLQATTDPLSLKKRLQLMQNAFSIIAKNPIFGVGIGNYLPVQHQFPERFAGLINQPVHNIFLLLTSEIGILSIVGFGILFFQELKKAIKNAPYIFFVILLTGMFDHYWLTLQQNFLLIGVILGVL